MSKQPAKDILFDQIVLNQEKKYGPSKNFL